MGVALKRGTMANWVIQVADLYLRPFWKRIRSELLTQSAIHADETVMQVHKEKDRPDASESRMWVYSSAKRAEMEITSSVPNLSDNVCVIVPFEMRHLEVWKHGRKFCIFCHAGIFPSIPSKINCKVV